MRTRVYWIYIPRAKPEAMYIVLMKLSSNCITGLYQNATNELHFDKMAAI